MKTLIVQLQRMGRASC